MSVLGQAYRIMYLSKGRTGLTDVKAIVFKPDDSVAGVFPLRELMGPFAGCYVYDYVSSTSDREGEYFSRVMSPSEGLSDIVRFSLYKQGSGDAVQSLSPNPLVAIMLSDTIQARVNETDQAVAVLDPKVIKATFELENVFTATILDQVAEATLNANETIAVPRYC